MLKTVQTVKRKYRTKEYEQIDRGERPFDLQVGSTDFEVEEGDLIVIVEVDQEGKPTGRKLTRRVSSRVDTNKVGMDSEDIAKHGLAVLGLNVPEFRTLGSIFNYGFMMGVVIEQPTDEFAVWEIVGGPNYLPLLSCPDFVEVGLLDEYNIEKWPGGRYSITTMVVLSENERNTSKDEPDNNYYSSPLFTVEIVDSIILTQVKAESEAGKIAVFEELNAYALSDGKAITLAGKHVEPIPPGEVDDYIDAPKGQEEYLVDAFAQMKEAGEFDGDGDPENTDYGTDFERGV